MTKYILIILLLTSSPAPFYAQETYIFKDKSQIYDVRVGFEKCDREQEYATVCRDKATFYLLKKNQTRIFQAIEMEETYLHLGGQRETKPVNELTGEDLRGVYFTDYNFDGIDDLALSNGNYAPYGGISYDVFLFSKARGKFIKSAELSRLETEMNLVKINRQLKTIETYAKSGCCWHERARYRFVNNRLQKFYVFTEDAMGDGEWMRVTTRRLVNGKWRTTSRRVLITQYYKNKRISEEKN